MDCLPPELTHIIFSRLALQDVVQLRLVCRSLASIGHQYLCPQLNLLFEPSSFKRMIELSQQPIINQHIKCLSYEADTPPDYGTFQEWKENTMEPDWWTKVPAGGLVRPPPDVSERKNRAYKRQRQRLYQASCYTDRSASFEVPTIDIQIF